MRVQKFTLAYTLVTIFLILAGVGYSVLSGIHQVWMDNREVVANLAIAVAAHQKAGEEIPLQTSYFHGRTFYVWGLTETNSDWLAENVFEVLPSLVYEGLTAYPGNLPIVVAFVPNAGSGSFHVLGSARPDYYFVFLNERFVTDELWNDEADALSTLIHELIHIQKGNFISGKPESFEAYTSGATVEIEAAMCNQGHEVACRSFWMDVEGMARASVANWFMDHGLDWYYQRLADLLFRDEVEERAARKSLRYWQNDQSQLQYILKAYSLDPWNEIVIPGATDKSFRLDTGISDYSSGYPAERLGLSFDDTADLLRGLWLYLSWLD